MRRLGSPVAAFFLLAGLFLWQAVPGIDTPGLSSEEALHGVVGGLVLAPNEEAGVGAPGHHVSLLGRNFPLMVRHDAGALGAYLLQPLLLLLGPGVLALRLSAVLWSLAGLLLFFAICRRWFGPRPAFLAGVLLATHPVFVQYARTAFYREEMLLVPLLMAALLSLRSALERRSRAWLFLAAFTAGAGLAAHLVFLIPLGAMGAVFALHRRLHRSEGVPRGWAGLALTGFILGAAPLILFNLLEPGLGIRALWNGADGALELWTNFRLRSEHLWGLLRGGVAAGTHWGLSTPSRFEAWSGAVYGAGLAAGWALALYGSVRKGWLEEESRRRALFLWVFCASYLVLSVLSTGAQDFGSHLLLLLPFPLIALALVLDACAARLGEGSLGRGAFLGAVLFPVLLFHLGANADAASRRRAGADPGWSTAVYTLADRLSENGVRSPVVFGRALSRNLEFLSGGKVRPIVCSGGVPADHDRAYRRAALERGISLWVRTGLPVEDSCWAAFQASASGSGRAVRLEREIRDGSGRVMFRLYAAEPPASRVFAEIAPFLRGGDPEVRRNTMGLLSGMKVWTPEAVEVLLDIASDFDDPLRLDAEEALVNAGPAVEDALAGSLRTGSGRRVLAAGLLLRLPGSRHGAEAEALLAGMLGMSDAWQTRPAAAYAFLRAGRSLPVLLAVLAEEGHELSGDSGGRELAALRSEAVDLSLRPARRRQALTGLASMGRGAGSAAPEVLRSLDDPRAQVRLAAVVAAGALGAEDAASRLAGLLDHPSGGLREAALWALVSIGDRDARPLIPALVERMEGPLPLVRLLAVHCAGLAGRREEASRPAAALLVDALKDNERYVRLEAVQALGTLGPRAGEASAALRRSMRRDPALSPEVLRALGKMVSL